MTEQKTEVAFEPQTPLECYVFSGEYKEMLNYLSQQDKLERSKQRNSVMYMSELIEQTRYGLNTSKLAWRSNLTDNQRRCITAAIFICGTTRDIAENSRYFLFNTNDLVELWKNFEPDAATDLSEEILEQSPAWFRLVEPLFINGLISRPTHENYLLGLMLQEIHSDRVPDIRYWLKHDPDLMQVPLLQLFELEGTSNINLAARDKYNHDPANTWQRLFLNLCQQGVYSRTLLLEKTLAALEKDWIQFRSGWFSRFHDALAPTPREMALFTERYLGLCHSRIAPTATMALKVLATLHAENLVDSHALLPSLQPVLSSSIKGQVDAALKLLDQMLKKDTTLAQEASAIAIYALLHEAADLQKKVIARLEKWGMDAATQEQLRQFFPQVATSNREALMALLGPAGSTEEPADSQHTDTATAVPTMTLPVPHAPLSPTDTSRALAVISDIDTLIEQCAYALENNNDTDSFEIVVDALLRLSPFSAEVKKQFGPVLKRAQKLKPVHGNWSNMDKPMARELARLLVFLFDGERLPSSRSFDKGHFDVHAVICQRTDDLMDIALQEKAVTPLASPSHQRGFIAPAILVERALQQSTLGMAQPEQEQILSLLRLAPGADAAIRKQAASLPETPYHNALRYALGSQVIIGKESALYIAAGRARYPHRDALELLSLYGDFGPDGAHAARYHFSVTANTYDSATFHFSNLHTTPAPIAIDAPYLSIMRHGMPPAEGESVRFREHFGGNNESQIRWSASMMPSCLEPVFAEGAHAISNNLDWWEVQWQDKAYLNLLLDPTVPVTSMAVMLLAFALAGKEPGQTAIAIDALVSTWIEGRLDVTELASAMRERLTTPLVKAMRYRNSLNTAARAHALAPHLVFQLLCIMVMQDASKPPKDLGALLELLNELRLELQLPLPEQTITGLQDMQIGGKGKAVLKTLLMAT